MRLALTIAGALTALSLLPVAAQAQSSQRVVRNADRTVVVTRDEDGRRRTRILVQRRSFLDPGTQVFPGEVRYNDSYHSIISRPFDVDRGTISDRRYPLPDRFELSSKNNPIDW